MEQATFTVGAPEPSYDISLTADVRIESYTLLIRAY